MMIRLVALFIAVLLGFSPFSARAEWREAVSPHFVIVSEGSERELIRTAQRLEAVHWLLTQATNQRGPERGQRVRVYLLHNSVAVRSAAGVSENSPLIAVYFNNRMVPTALAARDRPPTDLYHEYAHHFMFQYMPRRFPHWFIEGFAETVSTASFEIDGHITYGKVQNERRNELRYGRWIPTPRLFAERDEDDDDNDGERSHAGVATYGQYWVTAHYLLFAPERRGQLSRYIAAITRGENSTAAAETAFTGGLEQLDADVRTYLRRADFRYRPVPLPEGVMRTPTVRILRPGEEAALRLEMEAARTWGAESNAALLPRVSALAAQHPQEPAVHALSAAVLIGAEQFAEAIVAADKGLAADPAHARSNALRALARLRQAAEEGVVTAEDITEIRQFAERARTSDPREPALALIASRLTRVAADNSGSPEASSESSSPVASRGPHLVLTREQGQAFRAALDSFGDNPDEAKAAFAGLASRFPDTPLASYALRVVAWIEAGMPGDFPQMTGDDKAD